MDMARCLTTCCRWSSRRLIDSIRSPRPRRRPYRHGLTRLHATILAKRTARERCICVAWHSGPRSRTSLRGALDIVPSTDRSQRMKCCIATSRHSPCGRTTRNRCMPTAASRAIRLQHDGVTDDRRWEDVESVRLPVLAGLFEASCPPPKRIQPAAWVSYPSATNDKQRDAALHPVSPRPFVHDARRQLDMHARAAGQGSLSTVCPPFARPANCLSHVVLISAGR
jgi:hypothetical protein